MHNHQLDDQHKLLQGHLPAKVSFDQHQFEELWALHPDHHTIIVIAGKPTPIPRWQQAYERDYAFSRQVSEALPLPPLLAPLYAWARETIDERLNGLLVNWYDGKLKHYIGKHSDEESELIEGSPIVTVSLGEERIFRLRLKYNENLRTDFIARDGDYFVMPWETNLNYKHEVPRFARYKGRRVSVTFRAFL